MSHKPITIGELRMTGRVAPSTINLMLACYYSPDPKEEIGPSWSSESGKISRAWLQNEGLIDGNNEATERGKAWVEYICHTPVPIQQWVLPKRSEIET